MRKSEIEGGESTSEPLEAMFLGGFNLRNSQHCAFSEVVLHVRTVKD